MELIEKLRKYANCVFIPDYICKTMGQAADTIEELSAKLNNSQEESTNND